MKEFFIVQDVSRKYFLRVSILIVGLFNSFCTDNSSTKILFAGDLLLDRGVRERIDHLGVESLFDDSITSVFSQMDAVVVNLECPATKIKEPIHKKYIFRAEPEWISVLKNKGITHLNMANNHSMDQGRTGLVDTYQNIKNAGVIPIGYGENHDLACIPKLIASRPRNIYVFSSLQVPSENWVFLEDQPSICEASIDRLIESIQELRKKEPNAAIIVQLHWGIEHTLHPTIVQKQQAYSLIEAGVDLIIGHHSHTTQKIEVYNGKAIYYGLGNFIFDQKAKVNSEGILVQIEVTQDTIISSTNSYVIEKCKPMIIM